MNTYSIFVDGDFYWSGRGYSQVRAWAKALREKGYKDIALQRIAPTPEYRALGPMRPL